MFIAYLLLGSNLGNSVKYLADACSLINTLIGKIQATSSLYRTGAWGNQDQPDFMNQVVAVHTELNPVQLLSEVLKIEKDLGRTRHEKWGSRTIDIDILLYDNEIVDLPDLKIPHPYLHERRFCLVPLAEIAPDLIHPVSQKTIGELLSDLSDNLSVKKLP